MGLEKLATRKTSSNAVPLHVKFDGEKQYEGSPEDVAAKSKPVRIFLIGQDSAEYSAVRQKLSNKALNKMAKAGGPGKKGAVSAEQLEEDKLELAVAATKNWENVVWEGQTLPFSPENVRKVYQECPWLLEQVEEFVNDRANFLGNS